MVKILGKDILNTELKKDAGNKLKVNIDKYNISTSQLNDQLEKVQLTRDQLAHELKTTISIIDAIKNTPSDIKSDVKKLTINLNSYSELLKKAKKQSDDILIKTGAEAVTGAVAGTTIGVLGGPALTALAMSIGTASTGTAIAGLTGAAATNAALAWLGGGAIAAGGAGIAGGEAVLGLFGPIGWAIGSVVAGGSLIKMNGKNKKAASDMLENVSKVEAGTKANQALTKELDEIRITVVVADQDLKDRNNLALNSWPMSFDEFSEEQKNEAGTLVNNALSAEKILNQKIGK